MLPHSAQRFSLHSCITEYNPSTRWSAHAHAHEQPHLTAQDVSFLASSTLLCFLVAKELPFSCWRTGVLDPTARWNKTPQNPTTPQCPILLGVRSCFFCLVGLDFFNSSNDSDEQQLRFNSSGGGGGFLDSEIAPVTQGEREEGIKWENEPNPW